MFFWPWRSAFGLLGMEWGVSAGITRLSEIVGFIPWGVVPFGGSEGFAIGDCYFCMHYNEIFDEGRLLPIRTCVIYAWCLMMNHFHLLVMEKDWKIAEVIKSLASSYVYYGVHV